MEVKRTGTIAQNMKLVVVAVTPDANFTMGSDGQPLSQWQWAVHCIGDHPSDFTAGRRIPSQEIGNFPS